MKAETLPSVAARLYDANEQDEDKAIDALIAYAAKYPSYHHELLYMGAKATVSALRRSDRNTVLANQAVAYARPKHYEEAVARAGDRARATAGYVRSAMYNMTFRFRGKTHKLGDMTPVILRCVSESYVSQGNTMLKRGRWLLNISEQMADGSTVQYCYTEQELSEMLDKA